MKEKSDEIIIIDNKGQSKILTEHKWKEGMFGGKTLEDSLITLIEKYPNIIPGRQIDPESEKPLKFIMLCREIPVEGWSLDLLLVDQNGLLTLIECKLIQNPDSRRDVIGQIIEYASHSKLDWNVDKLKQKAIEYWGKNIDEVIN